MTIVQLQYFLAVCQYGSISKAAEKENVSQPAISSAIKVLEKECETLLFKRDNHFLILTKQGKMLQQEAETLVHHYAAVAEVMLDFKKQLRELRIGITTMGATGIIPIITLKYKKLFPDFNVKIYECSNSKLQKLLLDGSLHVAIATRKFDTKVFKQIVIHKEKLMLALHKEHPLAKKSSLSPHDIVSIPMVVFPEGYAQYKFYFDLVKENNLKPNVLVFTKHVNTINRFILSGAALGFMFESLVKQLPSVKGYPFESIDFYLTWHKKAYISTATQTFIDLKGF